MKRKILLVDDEVAVLLTLKAVLEINGFDVDTAASGREGRSKLHAHRYHMVITDMRMESDAAGAEVIAAARQASYRPAIALLTAFPITEEDWQSLGADKLLVKPTHTRILLQQIEKLLAAHEAKLAIGSAPAPRVLASNDGPRLSARVANPTAIKAAARTSPHKPAVAAKPTRVKKAVKILKMTSQPVAKAAATTRTTKPAKQ